MTNRHFIARFNTATTDINGKPVKTGMSSHEERRHVWQMVRAALDMPRN